MCHHPGDQVRTTLSREPQVTTNLTKAHRSLFPLRPVPYEMMMLSDDRPDHPMTCGAEFTFEGQLDRSILECAVDRAIDRHPLICANIEYRRGRPWAWVAAKKRAEVQWLGDAAPVAYTSAAPIDLRSEVGMRVYVQELGPQSRLYFDMHHACSDGAGGMLFVEDVLTSYAAGFPCQRARRPELRKLDAGHLLRRGKFPLATGISLKRFGRDLVDVPEVGQYFFRTPIPLAKPNLGLAGPTNDTADQSRSSRISFSHEFLQQLRPAATASDASVNDLLVLALFLSIHQWNTERGAAAPGDWVRVMVPVNLRTRDDLELPAANRLSNLFLTRRISELRNRQQLLRFIIGETAQTRRERVAYGVLSKLGMINAIPGGLRAMFSPDRCLITAALSNIGDSTRRFHWKFPRDRGRLVVGNVVLNELSAIPPVRPLTRVALLANTYRNQLTINMRYDQSCFGSIDAARFLDAFSGQLRTSVCEDQNVRRRHDRTAC